MQAGSFSAILGISGKRYSGASERDGATYREARIIEPAQTARVAFRVALAAALPSGSVTFTVFKNGVATSIVAVVTPADGTNVVGNFTDYALFNTGDDFSVEANPAGIGLLGYKACWSIQG